MLGVYVHIPYCRTLCPYCDFVKRRLPEGAVPSDFVEALCREIAAFEGPARAASVFFGGGTPSLLDSGALERVLEALHARFDMAGAEITLEANPDDVTAEGVRAWRDAGITRVSLGVQSFNEEALRYLGRRHDAGGARRACDAVAAVFRNWSLDLIFGVPPYAAWVQTVSEAAAIDPPHLSAYGLTYEPGTPFGKRAQEAIDDDGYLTQYTALLDGLPRHRRYEVSNFAKPGYECRHNMVYWRNGEYAGFGPGAYSFVGGVRARNVPQTAAYLAAPGHKIEALELSSKEIQVETVIQHLRLAEGLDTADFLARFGTTLDADMGAAIDGLVARGLVVRHGGRIVPTARGFELNNEIGLALVN